MKSTEKYAVITGCASGIGYEIAERLTSKGVHVIGLDIYNSKSDFLTYTCDVSEECQVEDIIRKITDHTDRVDYLVNAAGMLTIGRPLGIKDLSIKQWDAILKINLRSVAIMTKLTYPLLKNSEEASIVNISSEQTSLPDFCFSPYSVSKAGINMFTVCAAKEFLDDKIRVNAIALGTVKTNILKCMDITLEQEEAMYKAKDSEIPFGVIEKSNVVDLVEFLLSQKARYITGEIIRCDGGYNLARK